MKTNTLPVMFRPLMNLLLAMLLLGWSSAMVAADFNLTRDFSTNSNPNGAWSYGWKETLASGLNLYSHSHTSLSANGVPIQIIDAADSALPELYFNSETNTAITDGGQGQFPPRTVWYLAGNNGTAQNFGVIRFTAPSNSNYNVGVAVRSHLDGALSGDTDFYLVRNSTDVVGWFISANGGKAFTNVYALAAGETIDFAVGRGADNNVYASALKIAAMITSTTNTVVTNPPPVCTFVLSPSNSTHGAAGGTGFVAVATQVGCTWSVFSTNTWIHVGPLTNVGSGTVVYLVDANASSLARSGSIRIDGQNFLVSQAGANPPPVYADFNVSRDFSTNSNPNGVWSYGWQGSVGGAFTRVLNIGKGAANNGMPYETWQFGNGASPLFFHYPQSNATNGTSDGGQGQYPPGSLVYYAGANGTTQNLATIRFVAPSNSNYRLEVAARSYLNGPSSGDADFHIVRNGSEIFGQVVPGSGATAYTNVVALASGDTVDFAVGRGADNNQFGSGLNLTAIITPTTNAVVTNPPPVVYGDFNAARDFSTNSNPNGVWSYGWQSNTTSSLNLLTLSRTAFDGNGYPYQIWERIAFGLPNVYHNGGTNTLTSDGGQGVYPPGALWYYPGNGAPYNFSTIRFTAPSNSNYRLEVAARSYLNGASSGDTDFHIVRNGSEIFGQALPGSSATAYTNVVALASGDMVDFAVGRGADNSQFGSGLNITAIITPTTNASVVTNPPPVVYSDFNVSRDFTTISNPDGVWSYGWKSNLNAALVLLPGVRHTAHPNGTPVDVREFGVGAPPLMMHHPLSNTNDGLSGGTGHYPPGTLVLDPGMSAPQNLVVVRFTAPSNGNYRVATVATPGFDGPPQGDTDFHVIRNGTELFGRFLAPTHRVGYTNVLTLIVGDTIDFAVGRGADNSEYGSLQKLTAIITPTTNGPVVTNPPPVVYSDFNVSRDFTTISNPHGVWSYGWKSNLNAALVLLPGVRHLVHPNGTPFDVREFGVGAPPMIMHHPLSNTNEGLSGGTGHFPPGTLVLDPGMSAPQNLVVVRFTAPSNGNYRVATVATPGFDGPPQGDTDFHVIRNGTELFGRFLAPTHRVGYTNVLTLIVGDTIDFAVGRGADNSEYGSLQKLTAIITPTTNAPAVTNPEVHRDFNASRDFVTNSNPHGVWSYGWKSNVNGTLSLLTTVYRSAHPNGTPYDVRALGFGTQPLIEHHRLSNTNDGISATGTFPPGTLVLDPGPSAPQNLVVIRFTAPSNGNYRVQSTATPGFDGPPQGDTDFHVIKNGIELFGVFLAPTSFAVYSNILTLTAGDTIDFAVGRGTDNSEYGSLQKLTAIITPTTNAATTLAQPSEANAGTVGGFQRLGNGAFQINVDGSDGTYAIEVSTDLVEWTLLQKVVNSTGTIQFSDPDAIESPNRFYRARLIQP